MVYKFFDKKSSALSEMLVTQAMPDKFAGSGAVLKLRYVNPAVS